MLIYKRVKSKHNKNGHVVFESYEEAKKNGVNTIHTYIPLEVGNWFQYEDGRVAQILRIQQGSGYRILYETILNKFYYHTKQKQLYGNKYGVFLDPCAVFQEAMDLNEVTLQHLEFATNWLFRGMSLEDAVTTTYKKVLPQALMLINHRKIIGTKYKYNNIKLFAFIILSGHWFDKLLKTNRIYRDRYMSLVNALESAGITQEHFATKLKEHIDSNNPKASIPALKMAQEIFETEEIRKDKKLSGKIPIDSTGLFQMIPQGALQQHQAGIERLEFPKANLEDGNPERIKEEEELIKLMSPTPEGVT